MICLIRKEFPKIEKRDLPYFILAGFLEPFIYFLCETNSMRFVSPTVTSVFISTIPLFAPLAAYLFFRDKILIRQIIGIAISFLGMIMVLSNGSRQDSSNLSKGIFLLIGAVVSSIGFGIVAKKLGYRYSALTIVIYQNIVGLFLFLPLFLYVDYRSFTQLSMSTQMITFLLILGIFCSALAFVFYINGLKKIGFTATYLFTNLIPAVTALGSYFILQERLLPLQIRGIVVTVIGLTVASLNLAVLKNEKNVSFLRNKRSVSEKGPHTYNKS